MPRFEAASISITSSELPEAISLHESHTPQGSGVGPFTQFSAFAKIRAAVVLPTPLSCNDQIAHRKLLQKLTTKILQTKAAITKTCDCKNSQLQKLVTAKL